MATLAFTKMHGQGNDFVMLDGVAAALAGLSRAQVTFLADRHCGVGADQVLLLTRGAAGEFGYRIWNADGCEVAQCGNGARAAHAFLAQRGHHQGAVTLRTSAGTIDVDDRGDGHGPRAYLALPAFAPADIPLARPAVADRYALDWHGDELEFAALGLGNPHAVFWVADVASAPVAQLGAALNAADDFPAGVNVGFAQRPAVAGAPYRLRVHERGVGETRACGSGAAACAVVARREDGVDAIELAVPGGRLRAGWAGDGHKCWVEGEVTYAFAGEITLP